MARRDPVGIRLLTRKGNDWSGRFPLVVEAVNHLKVRSCLIDGEVVCCDELGSGEICPFSPTPDKCRIRPGQDRSNQIPTALPSTHGRPGQAMGTPEGLAKGSKQKSFQRSCRSRLPGELQQVGQACTLPRALV
jgi:hypothetical protein